MANSGTVTAGSAALASQYNNLRDDVLNITESGGSMLLSGTVVDNVPGGTTNTAGAGCSLDALPEGQSGVRFCVLE